MRPWNPLLLRVLRRNSGEIARRAAPFAIRTEDGRRLVAQLGDAFLGGYNAMLESDACDTLLEEGMRVAPHFRPFFFEGAAMGYLPRGYLAGGRRAPGAIKALLAMHPGFLYLYYVGLGFWFGIRHPRRPAALAAIEPHLDPLYFPLCYDGFGFKAAFFQHLKSPAGLRLLDRCPPEHAAAMHQGYGRALFFVYMDDAAGFTRVRDDLPRERRSDLEQGRALATAFTGIDRPSRVGQFLADGAAGEALPFRLAGVTWALTARAENDPSYFETCLAAAPPATAALFRRLPPLCLEALSASKTYLEWQEKTRVGAGRIWGECRAAVVSEAARP